MTDFDALASAAHPNGAQGPRAAMDALWRATFSLPEWHFAVHAERPTQPLVVEMDGKRWVFAFTDAARVERFYRENAAKTGGAHSFRLTMPSAGARKWIGDAEKQGIFGVHFNFGQPGWFAPAPALDRIHTHLMPNEPAPVSAPAPAAPAAGMSAADLDKLRAHLLGGTPAARACIEATIVYQLATPNGFAPGTQTKVWYFDLPAERATGAALQELIVRIFYDANVSLRRRQPDDPAWFHVATITTRAVDEAAMFAWSGEASADAARVHMPWQLQRVVWEHATCYIVDDAGRYDGMGANDLAELIAYRAEDAGRRSRADVHAFLGKLYPKPGAADEYIADRAKRFANIVQVRPAQLGVFRRAPGTQPIVSGPPQPAEVLGHILTT